MTWHLLWLAWIVKTSWVSNILLWFSDSCNNRINSDESRKGNYIELWWIFWFMREWVCLQCASDAREKLHETLFWAADKARARMRPDDRMTLSNGSESFGAILKSTKITIKGRWTWSPYIRRCTEYEIQIHEENKQMICSGGLVLGGGWCEGEMWWITSEDTKVCQSILVLIIIIIKDPSSFITNFRSPSSLIIYFF